MAQTHIPKKKKTIKNHFFSPALLFNTNTTLIFYGTLKHSIKNNIDIQ